MQKQVTWLGLNALLLVCDRGWLEYAAMDVLIEVLEPPYMSLCISLMSLKVENIPNEKLKLNSLDIIPCV